MNALYAVLPSLIILSVLMLAVAPWGDAQQARLVLPLLPYMAAHVFLARGKGLVPSPVMFSAGIVMDLATHGPLGFWALIYLFAMLIARQLPDGLMSSRLSRLSGLLLMVFVLAAAQVGLASLYQLRWINWHEVLAGTLIAGLFAAALDLVWYERRSDRHINVTTRGARSATGR